MFSAQAGAGVALARVLTRSDLACPPAATETPQPGTPLWLQMYDDLEITGLASDSQGNLFLARAGAETLKLDCSGEHVWSRAFGARVAVDADDEVYVAGVDSDGTASLTKLDRGGQVIYTTELSPKGVSVESLAVDSARNVAVSGAGLGTVKLDSTGAVAWRQDFSGQVSFDSRGHLWLTGSLVGSLALGATTLTSRGGSDVLLVELSVDGSPLLARAYGDSSSSQQGEAIALDGAGNVFIAGTFDGSLDFGTGPLELKPSACSSDAWCLTAGFVAKLDAQGNASWSKTLGPMRSLPSIAVGSADEVLISGVLPGGVRPFRQPLLLALAADGEPLWQRAEWPGTGIGAGHVVTVDARGDVVWALSARPSLELEEQSYLAKLAH